MTKGLLAVVRWVVLLHLTKTEFGCLCLTEVLRIGTASVILFKFTGIELMT